LDVVVVNNDIEGSLSSQMDINSVAPSSHAAAGLGLGKKLIACAPALLLLLVVLAPPLNHDVAGDLDFSQRWLGGEGLYSRLQDPNPPLIFVLGLVPAYIGAHTGLGAVPALQLCILLFGALAWWLVVRSLRHGKEGSIERQFLYAAPVFMLLGAGYDFGQREHLMAVGALPYLVLAARRAEGQPISHRYAVAVLAAVAFALKPYFLVIPALVELYLLLVRGWRPSMRDPVPWTMAAVWAIYAASLPLLFPDYLKITLPLISVAYLGGNSLLQTALVPRMAVALALLVPLLWCAFRGQGALVRTLGLAAVGAAVSGLIQRKGWSYHIVPIELFDCVLAGTLAARWLDLHGPKLRKYPHYMSAALSMLLVLFMMSRGEAPWRELGYADDDEETQLRSLLIQLAPNARGVLMLTPRIWPIYPALNYVHSHQTLPAMNIWVLQGLYRTCLPDGKLYRPVDEMGPAERSMFDTIVEDFAADPPPLVVVDRIPGIPLCGEVFNLVTYFKQHPKFASTWSRYEYFTENDDLEFYIRNE
jgi:hypothetical protein